MNQYGAVLVRPMTVNLSRKVAAVLVMAILSLLVLGNIAVGQLSSKLNSLSPPFNKEVLSKNENGLPSYLTLELGESAQRSTEGSPALETWIDFLKAHPESRINLTIHSASGFDREDNRRVASLVQLMSSVGIDPHRVRLIELPQFETVTESSLNTPSAFNGRIVVEIKLE